MKAQKLFLGLSLVLVLSLITACSAPAAPSPTSSPTPAASPTPKPTAPVAPTSGQPVTWTFAVNAPASSVTEWISAPYGRFPHMVEEATKGRLKFKLIPNLVPTNETALATRDGRADIASVWLPIHAGTFPLWDFGSLPFFFYNTPYEYEAAVNDPRIKQILDEEYAKAGLVNLMQLGGAATDGIFSNKPIKTVDDFKGVKIRSTGVVTTMALKLVGAAPLTMNFSEVMDALSRKTVDGIFTGVGMGMGVGFQKVVGYVSLWLFQSGFCNAIVVNQKSWDALPADLKQILRDTAKVAQAQAFFGTEIETLSNQQHIRATGLNVIVPDKAEIKKAEALTKPAIDEWVKLSGPRGKEILDIISKYASGAR